MVAKKKAHIHVHRYVHVYIYTYITCDIILYDISICNYICVDGRGRERERHRERDRERDRESERAKEPVGSSLLLVPGAGRVDH